MQNGKPGTKRGQKGPDDPPDGGAGALWFRPCCLTDQGIMSHLYCLVNCSFEGGGGRDVLSASEPKFGKVCYATVAMKEVRVIS